jgi:uncharacterized protein
MFIDIYDIGGERLAFDRELDLPALEGLAGETLAVLRVRFRGEVLRVNRGVTLRGRLEADLRIECSRCLEPFEMPLAVDVDLTLVPEAVEFATGDAELTVEDASLYYCAGGKAELEVIAAEQIYLNLPLKPICKAGCRGLCPECGANRNRAECGCSGEEIDPRLAPLLRFKQRRDVP